MTTTITRDRMNSDSHKKMILSTLWIFLSVNYIFCDVLSTMYPAFLNDIISGAGASGIPMTEGFLLAAGILLEIPFIMIILSRVLKHKMNRIVNIVAAIVLIIVQIGTLFIGSSTLHYWFFSIIEVIGNLVVIWYSWRWKNVSAI